MDNLNTTNQIFIFRGSMERQDGWKKGSSGLEYLSHQHHLEKQVDTDFKEKVSFSPLKLQAPFSVLHKKLIFSQFACTILTSWLK